MARRRKSAALRTLPAWYSAPRALFTGTLIVAVLYVGLNAVFIYTTPIDQLVGQIDVAVDQFEPTRLDAQLAFQQEIIDAHHRTREGVLHGNYQEIRSVL